MKIPSEINNKYEEFYHEDKRIKNLVLYIRDILFDDSTTIRNSYSATDMANSAFPFSIKVRLGYSSHYVGTNELDEVAIILPRDFEFFAESVTYVLEERERLEKERKEQMKENFLNDITSFMYEKNLT